ncbi:hypothetical protein amrb99_98280 [Actinomadura sp. RB99]|nr:hypothetical protein [Actinomadura sp. RB99]
MLFFAWVASLRNGWLWGIAGIFTAPALGFAGILVARIACEFVLIRFYRRP